MNTEPARPVALVTGGGAGSVSRSPVPSAGRLRRSDRAGGRRDRLAAARESCSTAMRQREVCVATGDVRDEAAIDDDRGRNVERVLGPRRRGRPCCMASVIALGPTWEIAAADWRADIEIEPGRRPSSSFAGHPGNGRPSSWSRDRSEQLCCGSPAPHQSAYARRQGRTREPGRVARAELEGTSVRAFSVTPGFV